MFAGLRSDLLQDAEAALLTRRIVRETSKPYDVEGNVLTIPAGVGIATNMGAALGRLLACADGAFYRAKAAERREPSSTSKWT